MGDRLLIERFSRSLDQLKDLLDQRRQLMEEINAVITTKGGSYEKQMDSCDTSGNDGVYSLCAKRKRG